MKKEYMKPEQRMVVLQHSHQLLSGSGVTRNSNNVGLNENIQGGHGPARGRQHGGWDDEDDWDE